MSQSTSRALSREDRHAAIRSLTENFSGLPDGRRRFLLEEMIATCLRLGHDDADTGELKLINAALKEMRYAFRVFKPWEHKSKVAIFGSARTPEEHPDYLVAKEFSSLMGQAGWMSITGAGDGIMKAGHEGPGHEASFGLRIRLPFETTANEVIALDPKLVNFRYFFTRKLMFLANSQAVVALPGGFGTMDEVFETLTLVQTGKSPPIPIILLEGENGTYWAKWKNFLEMELLENGWISPPDLSLFKIAYNAKEACDMVLHAYRIYHSSRYVRDRFVIRLNKPISEEHRAHLESQFSNVAKDGRLVTSGPLDGEVENLDLPRLHFEHVRRDFGVLRKLIDAINDLPESA